ncbi:DEAD/DEAH box helicase [Candidatus Cetobacterium colombiensis]|uniref:Transcription-repair-coupling factor n=1 Tax=Candidatus Cetobacterium colombiensis TaxID=3073100 RepID=A0ABU4WDJ3_9FUSO|nr:DEAD/DEAH box helicase [Candidatus Cetobacterium colombiensis]MDX8336789.1 DEAD/DEAH box helicase [Candidatus Cetobacterium colombiensis]
MFRKDIPQFLIDKKNSVIYIGSSNKNIDIYYENMKEQDINVIELSNIQEEDDYYRVNYQLSEELKTNKKLIILISLEGLLAKYSLNSDVIKLNLGQGVKRKDLIEILEKNDYKKNYLVEKRMEFSVRGDILDIYPLNGENPVRIEYFGDEIDRITYFSVFDQKSFEKIESLNMYINKNKFYRIDFFQLLEKIKDNRNCDVYLENSEIVRYKLEEAIVRERDKEDEIRELYEKIESLSKKMEVLKSEGDTERVKTLSKKDGIKYENISQIREGDYIIHENYGVGIYLGIQEIDGKDYLTIKYADEDRLFVPIEGLNKIERFLVSSGKTPELYNLGRRGFKRRREKLEEDMLKFAKEIVEIQARRALHIGYKFSPDTVWQEEFEEKFPYIETRDQKNAIKDVKRDMESSKVMDRIVCGDVGYGKTEVAIRAAFKCVMDGKQVLIVAPTTVLAQQHYERFIERYKDYPITLELLSRLSGDKEQKEIVKKVENGSVDIVIGTHRVLSGDLKFKNLGLIIVDEEQKFGVKDKEKLKKMKNNVDMLTLTATPIPRTLNYALLGIRDISVIETAPEGRVPVETLFLNDNKKDIREAIMKEIAREGQVFYIFNRVKRIEDKLNDLKKILPKFVIVDYIHGKMSPKNIREKLKLFQDGDIDILLSTTIIENGIDIENANTILIEGIDKLGLSQIYQLRGRVGRGKRKGYCYLIVDKDKRLGKKASERKETLKDIGEFGGGFKLSLEDMRIRGAGEILGDKQHGALETFGYNLYTKLLQEEVAKVKGNYVEDFETKVVLTEDSYIPKDYIEGDERLIIYRRLVDTRNLDDLNEIGNEIKDRFGELPKEVLSLLRYLEVKILAKELKIKEIVEKNNEYFLKFDNENVNFEKLMSLIEEKKARYSPKEDGLYYFEDILKFLYWYKGEEVLDGKI